ncbi:MAG: DUF3237 domain-containing protein [Lachnospiraceae bacterium]|nr:DUF3237 domain-containing protein [Lachnospiraceae bacterium]
MRDELLIEIRVTCKEAVSVEGQNRKIVMIPFTGEASGPYFTGSVIGTGVDTQKIEKDDSIMLSARYMLEGTDSAGNSCRVFVENQGNWTIGLTPTIVTDSPVLARWETARLYATADGIPEGVLIRIFSGEHS